MGTYRYPVGARPSHLILKAGQGLKRLNELGHETRNQRPWGTAQARRVFLVPAPVENRPLPPSKDKQVKKQDRQRQPEPDLHRRADRGLIVRSKQSKTNQEGAPEYVGIRPGGTALT